MKPHGPIIIIGSLNLDIVVQVDRLPSPGETVHGRSITNVPGGKGANQAVAAARLGAPVVMIGRIGEDSAGELLRRALRDAGVDDAAVHTAEGPTGTALIHTDKAGQNSITVVAGANAHLRAADLDAEKERIAAASFVLAQLEIPLETVAHLAKLCKGADVPLMLDPAPAQPLPSTLLRSVAWLTPNESEAAVLCGANHLQDEEAAACLFGMGAANVALKQGQRGVYVAGTSGAAFRSQGFVVDAVDTTAAGDCFNAAFAVALRRGDAVTDAARFANAAAALSATRHGAQPSLPLLAEVEAMLA